MKLKLISIITVLGICACSTTNITYNPKEFDTPNYQQNVENAVDASDILSDFDEVNTPKANLEAADFSSLVQADIYFNQGDYIKAYSYYKHLSVKYKDPRIIYKTIVCLEHFSATKEQIAALDSMVDLFIKTAPDSQLAKLFQIKVALNQNNLSLAEDNLDELMEKNPQNGRAILLFVSSLLTGDLKYATSETLTKFGDYVAAGYKAYPESNLVSAVNYATADNPVRLANRLTLIRKKFPNWDIPAIWSIGLLLQGGKESEAIPILYNNLKNNGHPAVVLQNMYIGALLRTKQINQALSYTKLSIQNNWNKDNALINLGIINTLQNNYEGALTSLATATSKDNAQASLVKLAIASIYDYQGKSMDAIKYYREVASLNPYLTLPANLMILNDYALMGDKLKADQVLYDLAKANKLDDKKTLMARVGFYVDMQWYSEAYKILSENYKHYKGDKDYLYMYASTAAMSRNTKQGIRLYKQYIKMDPQNAMGYNDLAYIYADQTKDYHEALMYANKAYALNPNDPNVLDTLGWVYYRMGNYKAALQYVKASNDKSYDPESAGHLKTIYTALNQPDMAAKINIINKEQLQANLKRQLLEKAVSLLMYAQFGIEIK